jgi:hypothetical protein
MPSLYALLTVMLVVSACSSEHLARNVYDGVQNRDQALKTSQEQNSAARAPSYPEYEKERERLKNPAPTQ